MSARGSSVATLSAEQSFLAREQAELLHEEIERLPRAFRLPVVLCYLEGLTVHEAARRLRCSHGTVRSRMARAREKLRRGLTRRGVVLPAAALAAALAPRSASASVSPHLCETTAHAAIQFAAGHSAAPFAEPLARGSEIHVAPQAQARHAGPVVGRRRRLEHSLFQRRKATEQQAHNSPGRTGRAVRGPAELSEPEARSGPHVRGGPRGRSAKQSGARRDGYHLRASKV